MANNVGIQIVQNMPCDIEQDNTNFKLLKDIVKIWFAGDEPEVLFAKRTPGSPEVRISLH